MYARGKRDGDEFHPLTIRFPSLTWAELVELKQLYEAAGDPKSVNLIVQEALVQHLATERGRLTDVAQSTTSETCDCLPCAAHAGLI